MVARNLRVDGLVSLASLPSQLQVLCELELCNLPLLVDLPADLITQSLRIADCTSFRELPETLLLKGDLQLERLPSLDTLPSAMEIEGLLMLDELCALVSLPQYLRVHRDLYLLRCEVLQTLPDGVSVDGDIIIENCAGVTSLPLSMIESRGDVRLRDTGVDEEEAERLRGLAHPALRIFLSFQEPEPFANLADAVNFWWTALPDNVKRDMGDVKPNGPSTVLAHGLENAINDSADLGALTRFLHKLRSTKEFRVEALRPALAQRAWEALELIVDDELSRPQLLVQIASSIDTCGDMIVWALNQIVVWHHIAHARGDREALRALGIRIMRLGIVHEHAQRVAQRAAVATRAGEDVEVYLRFEIALREDLDLPVSATQMLYPSLVSVPEADFRDAKEAALRASDADIQAWFSGWDEWQRQDRYEASALIEWASLSPMSDVEVSQVYDLYGDLARHPACFIDAVQAPFELDDMIEHWVATGRDFSNMARSVENFENALRRVNDHATCE
ncbi:Hypothetical Protein FCC1311_016312 [Hondaea fermentalgiana]|uniref:NEL domain-containing protein n=1 Tax=Hondaea fermentalgiana TaxID=2315210 RepID=A0A2R5GA46_9STRA|nr:Hypothetical Protein FCC1311_016312 [Hondaea fermentalgiana]|eukprot:GBG25413.1 Hypothetical Protein FCC1311_016312 [Hondaea fermentalgiana]